MTALRVNAAHDVLDGPVLAGSVHRLKDEQQRLLVLSVQNILQFAHLCYILFKVFHRLFFIGIIAGEVGQMVCQINFRAFGNTEFFGFHFSQ